LTQVIHDESDPSRSKCIGTYQSSSTSQKKLVSTQVIPVESDTEIRIYLSTNQCSGTSFV